MTRESDSSRLNPFTQMLKDAFESMMRQAYFCLPGKVLAFDSETQQAQVQCGIQLIVNGEPQTIAPISGVPVCFPGNGSFHFFHEVTAGTEGLIHFSQRAIDDWLERGGPVAPTDRRLLSVDDAFFMPGYRSKPGAIPGFINSGVGMASSDGATFVQIDGDEITAEAGGSFVTVGPTGVVAKGPLVELNPL